MLIGREAMIDRLVIDPSLNLCMGNIPDREIDEYYKDAPRLLEGLNIALLASNPELYSNKRIIEAAEDRGHNITFLNVKHCYIKLDSITPEVHYRGKKVLDSFDAIIPRIKPNMTYYGCAVIRQFEAMNVYCLKTFLALT
jgi:ribosomal protein S6--L-glutamate ligase